MKKSIPYILILLLIPSISWSESLPDIEILGRIKIKDDRIEFIPKSEEKLIPSISQNQNIRDVILNLEPEDETFVKGHVVYQRLEFDGSNHLKPVFVIESVKPISLRRIGDIGNIQDFPQKSQDMVLRPNEFSPWTIPVTTEVASAITMTSAMLLIQSLTASPLRPEGIQQMQRGLILSAGALMTGALIYEQITKKSLKK